MVKHSHDSQFKDAFAQLRDAPVLAVVGWVLHMAQYTLILGTVFHKVLEPPGRVRHIERGIMENHKTV
jgi:hypothetical protein